MAVVVVTGSTGLIGSETVEYFAALGMKMIGIDNDMRKTFFGEAGSTLWNKRRLEHNLGKRYTHYEVDIRDPLSIDRIFQKYGKEIKLVIHTAAQPSHDWAANNPQLDFGVNANGTSNMLEAMRKFCPDAVFIFTSTNKVYGDNPNRIPFIELEQRWEIEPGHRYAGGITEEMSVDQTMHSLFGASKLAADLLVQEYGRYFQMKTVCFRCGVLSGFRQSGVELHGFMNYLLKCAVTGKPYTIYGYKGKQVRDVIHSKDVAEAFHAFFEKPRRGGEVYNLGGGRNSNVSLLESIAAAERISGHAMDITYSEINRQGDHIWYISDMSKFMTHYPRWNIKHSITQIMEEIYFENKDRWLKSN